MEIFCKKCNSDKCEEYYDKQKKRRYICKECGHLFVLGDGRRKVQEDIRLIAALLYGTGRVSCSDIADLFKVSRQAVHKWIKKMQPGKPNRKALYGVGFIEISDLIRTIDKNCTDPKGWNAFELRPYKDVSAVLIMNVLKDSSQ